MKFIFQLFHPFFYSFIGKPRLIFLVNRQSNKFTIAFGFR